MPTLTRGTTGGGDGKADVIAERYSLGRQIARGGTSAVWLGRDELLGREVALKRIGVLPGADRPDVARAEREARLSAQLQHPHVVAVFDFVTDPETGENWLVMEYVGGSTLEQIVREEGRLDPDRAADLFAQAADGLCAAHAAGITHRDVKPANILVDPDGTVKLTDFGIARVATDPSLTQTGLVTGSPSYIAPEVASGGRGNEAADVWSLGATAFHALAGRPPYEIGDHVLGALYRIVHDDPPRLPDAGWMAPLLEGTMVKDPTQRWTMEQVRDFLTHRGQAAVPEPTQVLTVPPAAELADPDPAPLTEAIEGPHSPAALTWSRPPAAVLAALAAAAVLILVMALYAARDDGSPQGDATAAGTKPPSGTTKVVAQKPTARGMEQFIRDYVRTVADDPDKAWTMLTPKFQRESGGLARYRAFWDGATNGQVLSITAEPESLSVSYQVHFDNFDNGPGPTVLDLKFSGGRYFIDGERSRGFVPAG